MDKVTGALTQARELPSEPDELQKAIRMHKFFAKPVVGGLNGLNKALEMREFDEEEKENGETAIGAFMYQYWEHLDAKMLILLWAVGVYGPRIGERYGEDFKKKKRLEQVRKLETPPRGHTVEAG